MTSVSLAERVAARNLLQDAVTEEVVGAFTGAGIDSVLLKGRATAWRFYDGRRPRASRDSDLLVAPATIEAAERVLRELGFEPLFDRRADEGAHSAEHAHAWRRAEDCALVDLHWTLAGVGVGPERAWSLLAAKTGRLRVGSIDVAVLGPVPTALHVALHAAQHGPGSSPPLEDLGRAVERLDVAIWRDAAALAERLDAAPWFSAGLRLLPSGAAIADKLDLTGALSVELLLREQTRVKGAGAVQRFVRKRGLREKLTFVRAKLAPSPSYMRYWSSLARRGRVGMALAYLGRPVWVLGRAPRALATWWGARRRLRRWPSAPAR